jgi:hypothetical protein
MKQAENGNGEGDGRQRLGRGTVELGSAGRRETGSRAGIRARARVH